MLVQQGRKRVRLSDAPTHSSLSVGSLRFRSPEGFSFSWVRDSGLLQVLFQWQLGPPRDIVRTSLALTSNF